MCGGWRESGCSNRDEVDGHGSASFKRCVAAKADHLNHSVALRSPGDHCCIIRRGKILPLNGGGLEAT